jgi:hypothetical protein
LMQLLILSHHDLHHNCQLQNDNNGNYFVV